MNCFSNLRFLPFAGVLLVASVSAFAAQKDVSNTTELGRAEFGAANYLTGKVVLGAPGYNITDDTPDYVPLDPAERESDNLERMPNLGFFQVRTDAEEIFIGYPLEDIDGDPLKLSDGYKYTFTLEVYGTPTLPSRYPTKIMLNDEVIWELEDYLDEYPLPVDPRDWPGAITLDADFSTPTTHDDFHTPSSSGHGQDILWISRWTGGWPDDPAPTAEASFHALHVRPITVVKYERNGTYSGTRPTYASATLPSATSPNERREIGTPIFLDDIYADRSWRPGQYDWQDDSYIPTSSAITASTIKSPVWPVIGAEIRDHQLNPDAYDYLVDRGINMVYNTFQDIWHRSYDNELDASTQEAWDMQDKIEELTTPDAVTGEPPMKMFVFRMRSMRRALHWETQDQLDLIEDMATYRATNSPTEFLYLNPEVDGSEMIRYLLKPQHADPQYTGDAYGEVGDWTNIENGTTDVFVENSELFPSPYLYDYLDEWTSAMTTFNSTSYDPDDDDFASGGELGGLGLDYISGLDIGLILNTLMATYPQTPFYKSLPADIAGGPHSFVQTKTLLRQNVNLVVSAARGQARAFGRLMATRLDPWCGGRSTWFPQQMERAFRVFYYGGADVIDHEGGAALTDEEGYLYPTSRGAALFHVAKWIRQRGPRGEVIAPIGIMEGRGTVAGRHSFYDWEQHGNYRDNDDINAYLLDNDLYNVFFPGFGDLHQTEYRRLFTGNPYGSVDIVPAEESSGHTVADFHHNYDLLIMFGLNAMTTAQADTLEDYVKQGGTLIMAAGQFMDEEPRGTREVSPGGEDLLAAFGAVIEHTGSTPNRLGSTITDFENYEIGTDTVAGITSSVKSTWTTKASGSTTYPEAIEFTHTSSGGKLVLLSGEVLINTGANTLDDIVDIESSYSGTVLAEYAELAAKVKTVPSSPTTNKSDFIETMVLERPDALTLAVMNQGKFTDGSPSPSAETGNYWGAVLVKKSLFPGMALGDIDPVYTYNEPSGGYTPVVTSYDANYYKITFLVAMWAELEIPRINFLDNHSFESDFTDWSTWASSGTPWSVGTTGATDGAKSAVLTAPAGLISTSLYQSFTAPAAGEYEISALYTAGEDNWDKAKIDLYKNSVYQQSVDLAEDNLLWTEVSDTITLAASDVLEVRFWFKDIQNTTVRVDRVVVRQVD